MVKQSDLLPAKLCYSHIGGKLGTLLLKAYENKGWIAKAKPGKHYYITTKGQKGFARLGVDLSEITNNS